MFCLEDGEPEMESMASGAGYIKVPCILLEWSLCTQLFPSCVQSSHCSKEDEV